MVRPAQEKMSLEHSSYPCSRAGWRRDGVNELAGVYQVSPCVRAVLTARKGAENSEEAHLYPEKDTYKLGLAGQLWKQSPSLNPSSATLAL